MFFKKPTVQLPCRAHRSCNSHHHWTPLASHTESKNRSTTTTTVAGGSSGSIAVSNSDVTLSSPTGRSPTPIQCLPTELLFAIASNLTPVEQTCLALTCRSLACVLGTQMQTKSSRSGPANWFHHAEIMDIVQKDFNSDDYWRCRECVIFHRRRKELSRDGCGTQPSLTAKSIAAMKRKKKEKTVEMGVIGDPQQKQDLIYAVDYNLVKAVMDRHFLGSSQGICLQAMNCEGLRAWKVSETSAMVLRYKFEPKIVLDRLLLHSTYTFRPEATMFVQKPGLVEMKVPEFLANIDFWICKHECTREVFESIDMPGLAWVKPISGARPDSRMRRNFRCYHCPTEYKIREESAPLSDRIIAFSRAGVSINVWQNFGSGRSRKEKRWLHISSPTDDDRTYKWDKEEIGEAFGRILCSTKKEFERQLVRSDGRGSWYDPELEMRQYKTLPEKLLYRL